MKKKISIVGWYSQGNLGDEAFRDVFIQQWGERYDLVFGESPDLSADLIVYGGGGVVGGSYLKKLPKDRPVIAMGVDIPLNGPEFERLKEYRFERLYLRSKEYAHIGKYKLDLESVRYCPDLAFALEYPRAQMKMGSEVPHAMLSCAGVNWTRPLIGVNLSCDLAPPHLYDELAEALDQLSQNYHVIFFSLYEGANSDRGVMEEVASLMKSKPVLLGRLPSPESAFGLMGFFTRVISMRFHGCIFATLASRTFHAIARRGKHSLFCEQSGLAGYFMDLGEITAYKINQAFDISPSTASTLQLIKETNRTLVRKVFAEVERDYLVDPSKI